MRTKPILSTIICMSAIACLAGFGARPGDRPSGLFAGLEVGELVNVRDHGAVYEILIYEEDLPAGYKITEVGADYLVVRDHVGVTERRIPVTSIKSIARLKVGGR